MNININIFCNLYALSFINCKLYNPERCIINFVRLKINI